MKNKILILNMKMYMEISDIKKYIDKVKTDSNSVIFCPTAIYLPYFINKYKSVAIQNIYSEDLGAYTGSISALQVKKMGVNYAVIGHSECRNHFKEDDQIINKKIKSALDNELKVILCIGENLEEKKNNKTKEVLKRQLTIDLNGICNDNIIIAYEPVFSIGTGNVPTNKDIKETINFIKSEINNMGMNLNVVYGGSVNSKNIEYLSKIDNVDGFMIGKSSCVIDEVIKMIKLLSC